MRRIFLFFLPFFVFAGTVGKIAGQVIDAATNEPLAGANVCITALETGAASGIDGNYFILNLPPGLYDVEATMIGYRKEVKKGVMVYADRTSYLDFRLSVSVIEIDEPIVVTAKKPVIEIDITSKESRITRQKIDIMPVENIDQAITLQGGVTTDAAGSMHIRGGRSGEVAYYVDGIEVSNALLGETPIISKNLVSEMSLLSGTFNAEYGNVMSGVVNIVTPEGSGKYGLNLEYTSYMLNPSVYRKQDWTDSASDAHRDSLGESEYQVQDLKAIKNLPFLGEINVSAEGPVPLDKSTRFFLGADYLNRESYLPYGYDLTRAASGKLTRRIGPRVKAFLDMQYAYSEYQNYSHAYKYLYDNYLVSNSDNIRAITGINHAPTNNFFYNIKLGYIEDKTTTEIPGLDPDTIIEPVYDNNSEFYISGYPIFRQKATTKEYVIKADFNMQVGSMNNIKSGIEADIYDLNHAKREQLFTRGPIVYQDYHRKPQSGALFLQNKFEHRYLVMNMGIRLDYFDPKTSMWTDIEDPESAVEEVKPSYQVSPRLGLSHPITANSMLHFAYGHFFQRPAYEIMYFNSNYIAHPESIPRYGLVGNPKIEPQRTTSYEVGIKYATAGIYGIDVTLFLKDIKNLLATTEVRMFPYDYIIYSNEDFGSVQGFDLTVTREIHDNFGIDVSYTYQVARGNRSFAMQGFYDVYTGQPERIKEYFLSFDRRHTLACNLQLLPVSLGSIGVNFKIASGLPYTPYISEGVVVEENSARMDLEYSLDFIIQQGVKIRTNVLYLFIRGTNVTDHLNPRYVYARTGKSWDAGEEEGGLMGSVDIIHDPTNVGSRRSFKAGVRVRI